jgi:hypothetical protein
MLTYRQAHEYVDPSKKVLKRLLNTKARPKIPGASLGPPAAGLMNDLDEFKVSLHSPHPTLKLVSRHNENIGWTIAVTPSREVISTSAALVQQHDCTHSLFEWLQEAIDQVKQTSGEGEGEGGGE